MYLDRLFSYYEELYRHYKNIGAHWWPGSPFEIALSAVLVQNSKWEAAWHSITNLKKRKLTEPTNLMNADITLVKQLIKNSGFYNQKAEYLRNLALFWVNHPQLDSDTEKARKKLLSVKGIGKETADSILLYAFNYPTFPVSLYTRRVFTRFGILDERETSYEKIRSAILQSLSRDILKLKNLHAYNVEVARSFCFKTPKCNTCILSTKCVKKVA